MSDFSRNNFTSPTGQKGKARQTVQDNIRIGDDRKVAVVETELSEDESVPANTLGVIYHKVNERNMHRSFLRQETMGDLLGRELDRNYLDGFICNEVRLNNQIVAPATNPDALTRTLIESSVQQLDTANAIKSTTTVTYGTLYRRLWDPLTELEVRETRTVVDADASLPAISAGISYEIQPWDCERAIQIKREMVDWASYTSTPIERYIEIEFSFPAVISSVVVVEVLIAPQGRTDARVNFVRRAAFRKTVLARVELTLHSGIPTMLADGVTGGTKITLRPTDWSYRGTLFSINEPSVIVNSQDVEATTDAADTYYGASLTETVTMQASYPTYTQYAALVGVEHCIGESVDRLEFGLWLRRRTFITFE